MAKVQLKPDEHGNLVVPRDVLGEGTEHTVYTVERDGGTIRLEPTSRKLYDIEDPEERVQAFRNFIKGFAQKTGVSWPENYNFREDIYD
ncbi:hypothetical protein BH24DEI2_BH24DEI2_15390 [soil metagenome]